MPVLPLPGPSGIDAILMHRAKQDLLTDTNGIDANRYLFSSKSSKKSHDIFEFEYEQPYSENPRRRTPPEMVAEASRPADKKDSHINSNDNLSHQQQLHDEHQKHSQQPDESTATTTLSVASCCSPNPATNVCSTTSTSLLLMEVESPSTNRDETDAGGNESISDTLPSTSQHLEQFNCETDKSAASNAASTSKLATNFQVISKGEGFMAINATVDGVDYTGMLYSHNRNGMPGTFAADERDKFVDLCAHEKADIAVDQWMSMLADRQLLPGRQRRYTKANWAKRRGRMICYSCLCVVPEEKSMPFACNCKDRQRQRASRIRCGGYQPTRDRLVVVAQASGTAGSMTQHSPIGFLSNGVAPPHSAGRHTSSGGGDLLTMSGGELKHQTCSLHPPPQHQQRHGRRNSAHLLELKQSQPSVSGECNGYDQPAVCVPKKAGRKSSSTFKVTNSSKALKKKSEIGKAIDLLSEPTTSTKTARARKNSNAGGSTLPVADALPSFPPEKMAELSKPLSCTIPDNFQTSLSAPSSLCANGASNWITKSKLAPTLSAPASNKRMKKPPKEQVRKRRLSVSSAPWSDRPFEERSRFSERIMLERAMRESLEMAKTVPDAEHLKTAEQSANISNLPSQSAPVTPIGSAYDANKRCRMSAPPPSLKILTSTASEAEMKPIGEATNAFADEPPSNVSVNNCNSSQQNSTLPSPMNVVNASKLFDVDRSSPAIAGGGAVGEKRKHSVEVVDCEANSPVPTKIPKLNPVSVDVLPMPLDVVVVDGTPKYVIRNHNNSPLQMTILKVPLVSESSSSLTTVKTAPQHQHQHHHHHHHRRSRRDVSGNGSGSGEGSDQHHHRHHNNTNKKNSSKENGDLNGGDFHHHRSGSGKITHSADRKSSSANDDAGSGEEGRAKIFSPSDAKLHATNTPRSGSVTSTYGLRSAKRTQNNFSTLNGDTPASSSSRIEPNSTGSSGMPSTCNVSPPPTAHMTPARDTTPCNRPIRDKRLSLEARISTIKERLLKSASVSPLKPSWSPSKVMAQDAVKSTSTFSNSSPATSNANTPSKFHLRTPTTVASARSLARSPSTLSFASCYSSVLAADLPETVTSSVSALIRAEIHRVESTRSFVAYSATASAFAHGIVRGALVWARAPPSAYWPGLVIGVAEKSVKVAWCGEHTYNHVDVSTVSDFLTTLAVRFVPNAKENRGNKKLCNAVAEALALTRPPLVELDRRLNTMVAKLLAEKYAWNLAGVAVYRGGKLVTMCPTPHHHHNDVDEEDECSGNSQASVTPRKNLNSLMT